eukprot:1260772-Pleurochrysis_carterae.AAC.2
MSRSGDAMASASVTAQDGSASAVSSATHRWYAALCGLLTPLLVRIWRFLTYCLRPLFMKIIRMFIRITGYVHKM